jgi:translocation and assembly module TamB
VLEGTLHWATPPSGDRFDLRVQAERYPIAPIKEFFELDYPVQGFVTATFPIAGREDSLRGGGPATLEQAKVYGEGFDKIAGNLLFTPGKIALEEIRAQRGSAVLTGRGDYAFDGEAYTFQAQAQGLPLELLDPVNETFDEIDGLLTFDAEGAGTLARPNWRISATIASGRFFGRPVPEDQAPRLEARMVEGRLDATAEAAGFWKITASGDITATPVVLDVALDAPDAGALMDLTPQPLPEPVTASIQASGRFTLPENASGAGWPDGDLLISSVRVGTTEQPGVLSASGIRGSLKAGTLSFEEFEVTGADSSLRLRLAVGLEGEQNAIDAAATGKIGAATAGSFAELPLTGVLAVDVRAEGTLQDPKLQGSVRLEQGRYQVVALSQILEDIEGGVTFEGSQVSIDGLRARFGGGELYAAGLWDLSTDAPAHLTLRAQKVSLRLSRDARVQVDASLGISADSTGYDVRGEINVLRASYLRDFELTLATLLQRTRRTEAEAAVETWQDQTRLELRVLSTAGLEVRNNLARVTGSMDLLVRGTAARPRLYGQILLDEGSRVTFRDQRYEIEAGTITFAGSEQFAPILDIRARTEAGAYDVVVSIAGVWPRLQTTLTSDPPLPTGAIASLILTGEDPRASGAVSRDPSQSLASAAGDVVVGAAMSPLSTGAQKLFGLDRFRIDPTFQGGTISSARATIGKQITPELFVSYSQSFNSNEQPVFEVEWRASRDVLVEAIRDVYGNYILTVRRRQKL